MHAYLQLTFALFLCFSEIFRTETFGCSLVIDLLLPSLQQVSNLSVLETRENSMSESLVLTTRSHSQVPNLICDESKFQ